MEDEFYGVRLTSYARPDGRWVARAMIFRKDSSEEVRGVQVAAETNEGALIKLSNPSEEVFGGLPRPPYEWNRIRLRELLVDYRKFNNEVTGIFAALENLRRAGTMAENDLREAYWRARDKITSATIKLTISINSLPLQDQVDLMRSDDRVYATPDDSYSQDDMDSRQALFGYIVNPSDEVIQAYLEHCARYSG